MHLKDTGLSPVFCFPLPGWPDVQAGFLPADTIRFPNIFLFALFPKAIKNSDEKSVHKPLRQSRFNTVYSFFPFPRRNTSKELFLLAFGFTILTEEKTGFIKSISSRSPPP